MEDVASELVNGLMTLMASFVMVFVIFLPFLAIPYVFIKMGGIVSGFAKMASAPFRAGKFAAKRVGKKVTDAGLDRAGLYGRRKLGDFSSSDPALTRKGKPRRLGKRTFRYANKAAGWVVDGDKESASRKAILEQEEKKRYLDALINDEGAAQRSAGTKDKAAIERVQTVARSQREQLRAEDIKMEKEKIIQEGIHNDPERMLRTLHEEASKPDSNPMRAAALSEMIRENSAFGKDRVAEYTSGRQVRDMPDIRMPTTINSETQKEMTRAALEGSATYLQNPDLVEAYGKSEKDFMAAALAQAADTSTRTDGSPSTATIDSYVSSKVDKPATESSPEVKYWQSYGKKTDKILSLGADNVPKIKPYVSYDDALILRSSPDFRNANDKVRGMIDEIIKDGTPESPSAPASASSGVSLISGDEHGLR